MMVKNHENLEDVGHDLSVMYYSVAGFTTVLLVLIILCEYIKDTNFPKYTKQVQPCHYCTSESVSTTELPTVHITLNSFDVMHSVVLEFSN